ncbi:hypothetical protein D3C71_1083190 [compost metagenome]
MLADHAAHIATATARFRTEAHRVGGHAQRQALGVDDFIAHDVGQRHFRGRDQIARGFTQRGLEQVFLELGQLAGTTQRIGIDQHRHVGFFVAVLVAVQVEHELAQRTVQARDLAAQHGETRAGQLGSGLRIQAAVAGAQLDVIQHREIERARGAPAQLLDVLAFILAGRHIGRRQVGDAHRQHVDLFAQHVQLDFRGFQFIGERGHFGHDRRHVLALGLGKTNRLGAAVAQTLQFLGTHLDALAIGLKGFEGGHVKLIAARFTQALGKFGGLLAKKGWIKHGQALCTELNGDYRANRDFLPRIVIVMQESPCSIRSSPCPHHAPALTRTSPFSCPATP